jgi:hypothetical protein
MDAKIRAKIIEEVNRHSQGTLDTIADFCIKTQAKQHLSIHSLGKRIAKKFNLSEVAGIKLASGSIVDFIGKSVCRRFREKRSDMKLSIWKTRFCPKQKRS